MINCLLFFLALSASFSLTEKVLEDSNEYQGRTTEFTYQPGDEDFDKTGLGRERVYEDGRGYPAKIELIYQNGVRAIISFWDNACIHTLETNYPDHREIDFYNRKQILNRTEISIADTLRETRYYDDSLRVTSVVANMRDGRVITRYYDERQCCKLIETLYPDGRKESRQIDDANQERSDLLEPDGHGRINIRPISPPVH